MSGDPLIPSYRALKYSRLKGRVPEILARDTASAIEVSPRVIVSLIFRPKIPSDLCRRLVPIMAWSIYSPTKDQKSIPFDLMQRA